VNINLTLIVQMLVFIVLIWFTMKFVWPMILGPMEDRAKKIAHGLAAADRGEEALSKARDEAETIVRAARERASQIIEQANHHANELVEQAKGTATSDAVRIKAAAEQQTELETSRARESLRREVAQIAVQAASKLLEREIDPKTHADLLSKLATQI
jgi:F-type H+-transporting ATPase subunit b